MFDAIDCHVHIFNQKELDFYKKTAHATKFINFRTIMDIKHILKPFDFKDFKNCRGMYFLDAVDLKNVDNELKRIEKNLKKYKKLIGVKIYLGYQHFYANDPSVFKIAAFAQKHKITVTFHTGEIYSKDYEVDTPYANAKYIEEVARSFPDVKFVASHINWPNFEELFYLCYKYPNVYTCFSGCNDGKDYEQRRTQNEKIISVLNEYLTKYPSTKNKLMYGTDFFTCTQEFADPSSYLEIVKNLNLTNEEKQNILKNTALAAYPKLK